MAYFQIPLRRGICCGWRGKEGQSLPSNAPDTATDCHPVLAERRHGKESKWSPRTREGDPLHQVKKMSGRRTRAEALEVGLEGLEKVCHVTSVPE